MRSCLFPLEVSPLGYTIPAAGLGGTSPVTWLVILPDLSWMGASGHGELGKEESVRGEQVKCFISGAPALGHVW